MKIIFNTGKGGVGKTSYAAALALSKADAGHKVLLVEFGPKSYFQYIFSKNTSTKNLIIPSEGLEVVTWHYEEVLVEFITYFLKVRTVVEKFFASPIMKKLVKVAPSLRELVYLGKATSPFRNIGKKMDYDYIIIDAYATGHFLALLRSPAGMMEAVSRGPMHDQCKTILEVMQDPEKVEFNVITLPEKLPIIETEEFIRSLNDEFDIDANIVFNKIKAELAEEGTTTFETEYSAKLLSQSSYMDKTNLKVSSQIPYIYETEAKDLILQMAESI